MSELSETKLKERVIQTVSHNTLYGYAAMVWSAFLGFWATPYILRFLGNERYALWGIALSAFGVATFFDIGLGSALVLFIAEKRVRGTSSEVNATINSALTLYFCFGILGGLFLVGGGRLIVEYFLKVSPEFRGLATSILSIYGFLFMVQMPAKVYEDVLIGMQRLDITNKTGICVRTVERLLVVVLLMRRVSLLNVVALSGCVGLSLYFIEFFLVKRLIPDYRLRFGFRSEDARVLFLTGGQQFIASLGYIFVGVIDRFLLGSLLHVSMVTFYELATRPSQLLYQLSLRFFQPVYPATTELNAHEQKEKLRSLFKKGTKILFVFLTPLAWFAFFWAEALIHFWVGPGYELSAQMLRVLTVNYFVLSLNVVPSAMMFGLNKAWILSGESLLRIFLNLVLSFVLITRMGALGAPYGLTFASLLTTPIFFVWMAREVGIKIKELFLEVLMFPLLIVCIGSLFFIRGPLRVLPSFWRFSIFTIFFLFGSLFFYIGRNESARLLRAVFARTKG